MGGSARVVVTATWPLAVGVMGGRAGAQEPSTEDRATSPSDDLPGPAALGEVPPPPDPDEPASTWEEAPRSTLLGRRVHLLGQDLAVYVIPPALRVRRTWDPADLALVCPRTPCEVWLPQEVLIGVQRSDSEVVRGGMALPTGAGSAMLTARRPRGKRVAGAVFLVGATALCASFLGYGVAFDFEPLIGVGAAIGTVGLSVGVSLLLGAGRPRMKWFAARGRQ